MLGLIRLIFKLPAIALSKKGGQMARPVLCAYFRMQLFRSDTSQADFVRVDVVYFFKYCICY